VGAELAGHLDQGSGHCPDIGPILSQPTDFHGSAPGNGRPDVRAGGVPKPTRLWL
jgi:hypothetical protein